MTSVERFGATERRFDPEVDKIPVVINLGHIGLVDALLFDHPNPQEAPQRWAENPCIIPGED